MAYFKESPSFLRQFSAPAEWAGADTLLAQSVKTVRPMQRDEGIRSKEMNFVLAVTSLK